MSKKDDGSYVLTEDAFVSVKVLRKQNEILIAHRKNENAELNHDGENEQKLSKLSFRAGVLVLHV